MTELDREFTLLIQKIGPHSKLLRTWPLTGGVSAQVTALEVRAPDGKTRKMVVRQHGERDLKQNPCIAQQEFTLLQILQSASVAAPAPYYFDQSGEILPTPYIVIEYIEGETDFAPSDLVEYTLQLARHLAAIHAIDSSLWDLSFLPVQETIIAEKLREQPAEVDESLEEGRIRDILASVWPLSQRNIPTLLHGDFWPGNILWNGGQIVAILDWEDAKVGDPLADLANGRLEVLWAFGIEAMHNFAQHYQSIATGDLTDLPYWDLYAALRHASKSAEWATYDMDETTMREGYRWFVTQALEKLAAYKVAGTTLEK